MPDSINEPRATNETIKVQLQGVRSQIDDIKKLLVSNEDRIRCLERTGDKTTPINERRLNELEIIAKDHDLELDELRELIEATTRNVDKLSDSFGDMQKIWKWALGIFTTLLVAVLLMLITGQAEILFK